MEKILEQQITIKLWKKSVFFLTVPYNSPIAYITAIFTQFLTKKNCFSVSLSVSPNAMFIKFKFSRLFSVPEIESRAQEKLVCRH